MIVELLWGLFFVVVVVGFTVVRNRLARRAEAPTRTLDNASGASNPGDFVFSAKRMRELQPELLHDDAWAAHLQRHPLEGHDLDHHRRGWWSTHVQERLRHGDARAAVVVSLEPLLIAAYSDDLDCVALVHFDEAVAREHGWQLGARLITVNTYRNDPAGKVAADLQPGPNAAGGWHDFGPLIADVFSEETGKLAKVKATISEAEWRRAEELGRQALERTGGKTARDGRPLFVDQPGSWTA